MHHSSSVTLFPLDLTFFYSDVIKSSLVQLTNTRRSDGAPEPDGVLKTVTRAKIIHYHLLYLTRPDPIEFLPVSVDTWLATSGCIYDDFSRLLFLHAHREASTLANELPEESDQFRFLHDVYLANLKGSVGLILAKVWL